jgi:hypothetical protein
MNKFMFIFLAGAIICSLPLASQPKFSNEFLNIGVGARALGMGNVSLANVNDVTAGYWNPSALVNQKNNLEVALMHSEYFAGIAAYEYGGLSFKLDSISTLGVSFLRFGVDDIPNTIDLVDANGNFDYNRITSFSSADNAFLFSYARVMGPKGLSLGGNIKVIYRKVGDFASAIGFGADLSASYRKKNWLFGAMIRDVTNTFNAWSFNTEDLEEVYLRTGNEIPENSLELTLPKLLAGAGYVFNFKNKFGIYPEVNLEFTFDGKRNVLIKGNVVSVDAKVGLEANYKQLIFLRMGINNIQEETLLSGEKKKTFQPNIGVGVQFKKVALDYALTDVGDQSVALYSNVFSLRIGINKRK